MESRINIKHNLKCYTIFPYLSSVLVLVRSMVSVGSEPSHVIQSAHRITIIGNGNLFQRLSLKREIPVEAVIHGPCEVFIGKREYSV